MQLRNVGERRLHGKLIFMGKKEFFGLMYQTTIPHTHKIAHTHFLKSGGRSSRMHASPRCLRLLGHHRWSKRSCCDPGGSETSVADVLVRHHCFWWCGALWSTVRLSQAIYRLSRQQQRNETAATVRKKRNWNLSFSRKANWTLWTWLFIAVIRGKFRKTN